MTKKIFLVDVKFVFEGKVKIEANSVDDAYHKAANDFGMVAGDFSTSGEHILDWNYSIHPEQTIEHIEESEEGN